MLLSSDKYQHKITDAVTEIVPKWKPTIINERDNQSANNYNRLSLNKCGQFKPSQPQFY